MLCHCVGRRIKYKGIILGVSLAILITIQLLQLFQLRLYSFIRFLCNKHMIVHGYNSILISHIKVMCVCVEI